MNKNETNPGAINSPENQENKARVRLAYKNKATGAVGHGEYLDRKKAELWLERARKERPELEYWLEEEKAEDYTPSPKLKF